MKQWKRLLSLGMALILAFCTLSAGMVVHAEEATAVPFASLKVGNRKVKVRQNELFYAVLEYDSTEAKVSWTLNEGWSVSYSYYYTSEGYYGDILFGNGDTIRVPKNGYADVRFTVDGDTSSKYRVQIFNGKPKLKKETFWVGTGSRWPDYQGLSGYEKVVSIKSSKPDVLKVKKADVLNECWLTPKKPGKSKVTVVLKIDGKKRSFSATYTVKKYPQALASLKVNGKKVDLKKNPLYAEMKVKKAKSKLEFKAAKGWKVKCYYYDNEKEKTVKVKSGDAVNTKKWITLLFEMTKGSDTLSYELTLEPA